MLQKTVLLLMGILALANAQQVNNLSPRVSFSGATSPWNAFGFSGHLPSDWQKKDTNLYEKKVSLSSGNYTFPIVLQSVASHVEEPENFFRSWINDRAIPVLLGKKLSARSFYTRDLLVNQGRLESGEQIQALTIGLRFPHFSSEVMAGQKAKISNLRVEPMVKDGEKQFLFRYSMSAKKLKGKKIFVLARLFYQGKITPVANSWNFTPAYGDAFWKRLDFTLKRSYLANKFGSLGAYKMLLTVHSAATLEILGWSSLDFDLTGKKTSTYAKFGELKLESKRVNGANVLYFHYPVDVQGQKNRKIHFKYSLYGPAKQLTKPLIFDDTATYSSTKWNNNDFWFKCAGVWEGMGKKGGMIYCILAAYLKDSGQLLGWKIVPFLYSVSHCAANIQAIIVHGKDGCLMIASRIGLNDFYVLDSTRKKQVIAQWAQIVKDELAVATNVTIQLPPRRPELEKFLIDRKSWKYNYSSSFSYTNIYTSKTTYNSSSSHSHWFFHLDHTCDREFANSSSTTTSGMQHGECQVGSYSWKEPTEWKNIPFQVRGEPKGPYWILLGFKDIPLSYSFDPNAKGKYGGKNFQGTAINGKIEGDYNESNDYASRVENH